MKAQPQKETKNGEWTKYVNCEPAEATHVMLHCPGPFPNRRIPVVQGNATRRGTPCWTWNGDVDKPTLKPSILTRGRRELTDEEVGRIMKGESLDIPDDVCHSFVTDGQIRFLSDCTHEHAGKTMDLLEVDWNE